MEDAASTFEFEDYFVILPRINGWEIDPERIKNGRQVEEGLLFE